MIGRRGGLRPSEAVEQWADVLLRHQKPPLGMKETQGVHTICLRDQRIKEPIDIEQGDGLVVQTDLPPCEQLEKLIQGAEAPG